MTRTPADRPQRFDTDPDELRARGVLPITFAEAYARGSAGWEIGRPQPAVQRWVAAGALRGAVLDIGCGTGENAILLAQQGAKVTGVDLTPLAIERARAKAAERGVDVEFLVHDALRLIELDRTFTAVLDSGTFHVFSDVDRAHFLAQLCAVVEPGGSYFMLCFSDAEVRPGGPRRVTRREIEAAFADGWTIDELVPTRFDGLVFPDGAAAWAVVARRTP